MFGVKMRFQILHPEENIEEVIIELYAMGVRIFEQGWTTLTDPEDNNSSINIHVLRCEAFESTFMLLKRDVFTEERMWEGFRTINKKL